MVLDKSWFCESVQIYQNSLYNTAYHMLRNRADAEDALQDTLYKAYSNLHRLKDPEKCKAWMFKILVNTCYEMLRSKKEVCSIEDYTEILPSKEMDISLSIAVKQAIRSLDETYRSVVLLYYFEDFSVKEIAEILGITGIAVKKRLSRARQQLKDQLQEVQQPYEYV